MITAQGGITKWQRVRISSDGGMVAGKLAIAKGASYLENQVWILLWKTYREAKEKAEKCKAALASGNPLPTSRTPNLFSAYCMGWLHAKKSKVKESTYIKYSTVVEKHIIPKLGDCCPLGFTTELMDDFIRELQFEDELAPKTVHDILVVLHGILKFTASKCKGVFPTVEINYPKIGKRNARLSREEQARFISYLQRIWIHADLVSCWRCVQASESVNSVRCVGNTFLQEIKQSKL